jgi:uncharacterized protein (TIGR02391 family)
MESIHELIRENREEFLALPPEELAVLLLQDLASRAQDRSSGHRGNYCAGFYKGYGPDAARAVSEAWAWLVAHGCLALDPEFYGSDTYFITRHGIQLLQHAGDRSFITEQLTFKESLHPTIAQKSWSSFIRREFDLAVFAAMKQVEVSVRKACGFGDGDFGVKLMRKAFDVDNGPLTDLNGEKSERQALSDLFAGAIGCLKNPQSHRDVKADQQDAIENLILAGHLLRIVEARSKT